MALLKVIDEEELGCKTIAGDASQKPPMVGPAKAVSVKICFRYSSGAEKNITLKADVLGEMGALIFDQTTYERILAGEYGDEVQKAFVTSPEKNTRFLNPDRKNSLVILYADSRIEAGCGNNGHPPKWIE